MDHEIVSDGRTVWINTIGCIGRFGKGGIDIHRILEEQVAGEGECLFCTHVTPTLQDWVTFQQKMRDLHGVEVENKHRPRWLPSASSPPRG